MDPQLGRCFRVLVEVEGRYSTAPSPQEDKGDSRMVPSAKCVRCLVMEYGENPKNLGLYCLLCCWPAVESIEGILLSVCSFFRGKKGIFWPFFPRIIWDQGLWNVQSLKWVLLLNQGHRDVTFLASTVSAAVYFFSWYLGDADPWSQQAELLLWSIPKPKWARWLSMWAGLC